MREESVQAYYAKRAHEYERVYEKPERQADLARLRAEVPPLFEGARVLEIACGTGYWTQLIAARAEAVVAVDCVEEVLEIARTKRSARSNVRFERADAYRLPVWPEKFSGCFAGFWWSHVPQESLAAFLAALHACLAPGARVAFLDNRYVEGSSTPLSCTDPQGNTYQMRRLADGSRHQVLKNFPVARGIEGCVRPIANHFRFYEYDYYWMATYRTRKGQD